MGASKKQTAGWRYYMGMHLGVCHGPVDALVRITSVDRTLYSGNVTASAQININAPDAYGGDAREGGVVGALDVMMGEPTQAANSYLTAQQGASQPAYRGRLTLVFRGGQVACNNYYLKPWVARVRRALQGWDGGAWYPAKAVIALQGGAVQAMNPAHIIYESLTNRAWGMGYPRAALDDAAFTAAADQLYTEGLGLCLLWSRQDTIESFAQTVLDHIGGVLTTDRGTGLFRLDLIRGGYSIPALPVISQADILELTSLEPGGYTGTVNDLTVIWHDPVTDKDGSVSVQALGAIQAAGAVIPKTVQYPGIADPALAARLAQRDLRALATPLKRIQIKVNRKHYARRPGEAVVLALPREGLAQLVCRVGAVNYGSLDSGAIELTLLEDVYALPAQVYVAPAVSAWVPPALTPVALATRRLIEVPYRDLAQQLSAADLSALAADAGYVAALAPRPSGVLAINYDIASKLPAESAYAVRAHGNWVPSATLSAAITAAQTVLPIAAASDMDTVAIGSAALIDDEIMRIDAIDLTALTVTVGRGCADSVPKPHALGARLWCYDAAGGTDPREYALSDVLSVKLLPRTGSAVLDLAAATADTITLAQRAYRPYPPGKLLLNASAYPAAILGAITTAWVPRDRVVQADQLIDTTAAGIGPEAGVTYALTHYGEANTALRTQTGLAVTSDTWLLADEITASALVSPAPARVLVAPAVPDYNATVLADVPVAYWKLNETSGTAAADSSGNALAGTYTGGYTLGSAPPSNAPGAVLLNGSSGYVNCGTPAALNLTAAWTLEAWIYLTATPNGSGIISEAYTGSGNVLYALAFSTAAAGGGSTLMCGFYTGSAWKAVAGPTPSLNAWHHAVATWDGTTLLLYLDGAQVASFAPGVAPVAGNNGIYLGRRWDTTTSPYFPGRIAAAAIYGSALSAARVSAHYSAGIATGAPVWADQPRANGTLRVVLKSTRSALDCAQPHDVTVARAGYGYQFGNYYGGV